MLDVYYDKSRKLWVATWSDNLGQLGDAVYSPTKTSVIFNLAVELGRNPERFTRPMSTYFTEMEVTA